MTPSFTGEGTLLVVATRGALTPALRLLRAWPDAVLAVTPRIADDARIAGVNPLLLTHPMAQELAERFHHHPRWIFFLATGAVVRLIAPLLRSKFSDPAVVVVDGRGRYAIPLLSGHLGGANTLARETAFVLEAEAILTTASDTQGTIAVDLLGQEEGWLVEADPETLRRAAACLVNDDPVLVIQECGARHWQASLSPLPENIRILTQPEAAAIQEAAALLWITHRPQEEVTAMGVGRPLVLYRPPREEGVILGIGCDRDTALETIVEGVERALQQHGLALTQVREVATIDRKGDEPGLLALVRHHGWPLILFTAEQLAPVAVPNPSAMVQQWMGIASVAEAAALLAAGGNAENLLIQKQIYRGSDGRHVTVAAARSGK